MEVINYVEFKKERDLGAIISDAFKFIRLEGKSFFSLVLRIAAVPILIAIAAMLLYMYSFSNIFTILDLGNTNVSEDVNFGFMFVSILLLFFSYLIAYVMINLAAMYYIKLYIDNQGKIDELYIRNQVKERFWSFTGMGFLIGLMLFAGMLFCFIPFIYLYPVLSLAGSIFVFQNVSGTDAISKSFSFIKGYFWETLGVMIVVGILVGILGYVFQIPAMIYQIVKMTTTFGVDETEAVFSLFKDPIYLALTVVSYVGQFMFYAITLVTQIFIYFDINEQENATGSFEKIDSLGRRE